jgi:hypothetical protein
MTSTASTSSCAQTRLMRDDAAAKARYEELARRCQEMYEKSGFPVDKKFKFEFLDLHAPPRSYTLRASWDHR